MPQVTEDRELIRAQARYVHSSARKARLVLEHIRGKSALEAQSILAFQTRAVARDAGKVLKSAIANAETNNGHDAEDLVVVIAYADDYLWTLNRSKLFQLAFDLRANLVGCRTGNE